MLSDSVERQIDPIVNRAWDALWAYGGRPLFVTVRRVSKWEMGHLVLSRIMREPWHAE